MGQDMSGMNVSISKYSDKIVINNLEILQNYSILKTSIKSGKEIKFDDRTSLFVYENNKSIIQRRITIKQVKFLSKMLLFFVSYQNSSSENLRFIALRSYVPLSILDYIQEDANFFKQLPNNSPLLSLKKFVNRITLGFSDSFTSSFVSLTNVLEYRKVEDAITYYVRNYRSINRDTLNFYKTLMKNELVVVSSNLFGDGIINVVIPNQKTHRNIKVFNKNSYLIPIDRISIFDLVLVYLVSYRFKIRDNVAVGKLSKGRITSFLNTQLNKDIIKTLNRLKVSNKSIIDLTTKDENA